MWNLFIKTLKDHWKLVTILSISSISFLLIYVILYPTIAKQAPEFEKLLSQYPKELWSAFGLKDGNFGIGSLEDFLSSKHFSMMWPLMTIGLTTSLAVNAIAGEIETKTMEILLSLPVSRVRVIIGKVFGGIVLITIYSALSVLIVAPMVSVLSIEGRTDVYFPLFVFSTLFAICTYSVSILLSAVFSKSKATLISIGIFVLMYVLNVVSTLKDSLINIKYFSFFYYFDTNKVIKDLSIPTEGAVVFTVVSIISFVVAVWYFNKRDVAL